MIKTINKVIGCHQPGSTMEILAILLWSLVAVSAYPTDLERIVGGSTTTINQYPEMAAILFSGGTTGHRQSCGGSILNNRAILSAAHCTHGLANARLQSRLGSTNANSGGRVFTTSRVINHPSYNVRTLDNDISIVHVSGTISFGNTIRAARIGAFVIGDNQVVWAAGWGRTSQNGAPSEQLRHVQIWTVNQNTCNQRYNGAITANMLCAGWLDVGGRGVCNQDSGGPLFNNGVVVGVTSFSTGCATPRHPGVFARVSRYISWINNNR